MDGVHDMGGMHGFGPVEQDEAAFHEPWEREFWAAKKVLGLHGLFNKDQNRAARERMAPIEYLRAGYYEQRVIALERQLVDAGVFTAEELRERVRAFRDDDPPLAERTDPERARQAREAMARDSDYTREPVEPHFDPGDAVMVRNDHPVGHTRVPRYARRARGVVERHHGTQLFADANARGEDRGEPLYSVRFEAEELWGPNADGPGSVVLELWEPYLDPG